MSSAKCQPENSSELTPPSPGIFPLHPGTVQSEFRDSFAMSSGKVLDLIRTTRSSGPKDEFFPYIVRNHVIDWQQWHLAEKDFSDTEMTRLLYEVGILYGVDMAQTISRQQRVADDLRAENPEALNSAVRYLYQTYRGLPDSEEMPSWRRQKLRELRYTGSDILTIANATLNDKINSMIRQNAIEIEDDTELGGLRSEGVSISGSDSQALLTGLVDGAIFIDAYERFAAGKVPLAFEEPVEYRPTHNPRRHVQGLDNPADYALSYAEISFESSDSLDEARGEVGESKVGPFTHNMLYPAEARGVSRLVQYGPNSFGYAVELKELKVNDPILKLPARVIAGSVAVIDLACAAPSLIKKEVPSVSELGVNTLISLGAVGLLWMVKKKEAKKVFERDFDVPIVKELSEENTPKPVE